MDNLYMFAKSFKTSSLLNRMFVDWSLGLSVACFKGAVSIYFFGSYGFELGQYLYLLQSGSKMIAPIFRMLKDGPTEDEKEELILVWVQYGVVVATFYAPGIWAYVSTTVKDVSVYHLALLTVILSMGISWLVFQPFSTLDRAYVKYRQLESQVLEMRRLLVWQSWNTVRPIFEVCNKPVRRMLTRIGRGMRILPPVVPEKNERPFKHDKMVTLTEIRLLRLVPSPFSRVVRCHMEHHPLDQAPSYEAISYHWGDNSTTHRILIDGCWFQVTQNAHDALHNRSFFARTKRVWIDSVCIDQNDDTEKTKQVRLMTKIYKQASRVIVFLGSRPDAHMVNDLLAELDRRRKWYDESVLGEKLYNEYLLQEASPRWQAFLNLLAQPWFERIWVLQEVAVADTVHAVYDNRYIDWETLVELLRVFLNKNSADARELLYSAGDNYKTRQISSAPGFASIMTSTRQLLKEEKSLPLSILLQTTHAFKATNPRDKLFALMGISDPASYGPVQIDYAKDVSSLYREAARYILMQERNLSLLHNTGIGSSRNLMDLPSWAPDWSCYPNSNWSEARTYTATKERRSDIRGVTLHGVRDLNAIAISGKVLDMIQCLSTERVVTPNEDGVYEGGQNAKRQYSWYAEMRDLVEQHLPETYATGQPKEEALWRTIIGDQGLDDVRPASGEYGDYYQLWHRILADNENLVEYCKRDVLPPGFNTEQELSDAVLHYTRFGTASTPFNCGRRFCVTKNRYIGMLPARTQPGDLVCILFGADTPFVIREAAEPNSTLKSYKLVGDCYIHGMMDGEGLESQTPEELIILR
jgi:Heterokaryon incompatibility protein (HET)